MTKFKALGKHHYVYVEYFSVCCIKRYKTFETFYFLYCKTQLYCGQMCLLTIYTDKENVYPPFHDFC